MKQIAFILFYLTLSYFNCSADELNLEQIDTDSDHFVLWAALFSLGLIGIIALFFSSESMRNYQKRVKEEKREKEEYNKVQGELISEMTENIQNIAQETVNTAQEIYKKDEQSKSSVDINRVVSSEKKLLSITTNLIEFLRIKSRKIEVFDEKLILSNLLNDVTGMLKEAAKNIDLNLVYNVKKDIPEYLNGDTLNLSKIIVNLAIFCLEHNADEIIIEVSKDSRFSQTDNLYFKVISFINVDVEDNSNLFNSNYNETTQNYDSLSLFIAKELATLMDGDIITKNNKDGSVEFTFFTPFKEHPHSKMIKEDNVNGKRVYLLDLSENTTQALNSMLSDLQHSVKIDTKVNCLNNIPDFTKYDLVIIDEKILTFKVIEALKKSEAKIISLSNIFKPRQQYPNSAIIDIELTKPVTRKQLAHSINSLYEEKTQDKIIHKELIEEPSSQLLVHRGLFEDLKDVTLNSFSQFRGTEVLLVEDNLINQKVATSLLKRSGTNITVAGDGKEALDILHDSGKEFDIVFMDINMPVMDGYTATKMIKANQKFINLPIVALSALTSPDEINEMFNCGMNGYLEKPLKIGRFYTAFSTFIEKKDETIVQVAEPTTYEYDGLNIEVGILQASKSDIFYKEILLEFRDAYGDSAGVFEKLVNDFRFEQLRMLCVDLKGLSGSIGGKDMNKLITEVLQRLLHKKYELMPMYIEPFNKELNRILNSIDLYTKQT